RGGCAAGEQAVKRLFVIRHCRAEGQPPEAPLTPEGRQQAEVLADLLSQQGVQRVIASPFLRARQTAEPLARRLGLPVEVDSRLAERVLAGEDLPDWLEHLRHSFIDLDAALPGGESSRAAMERAAAAVAGALAHPVATTALVTHGNLMALLLKRYDDRFGFDQWQGLTNPDAYLLTFDEDDVGLKRVWS
ncbi:MAG TPA: histidine phosphatase family protein, partial [Symbiobacteriaceae bacterium]|nr:histidine phosphatase family protein [Symbiobacteriaceae bacterium]